MRAVLSSVFHAEADDRCDKQSGLVVRELSVAPCAAPGFSQDQEERDKSDEGEESDDERRE